MPSLEIQSWLARLYTEPRMLRWFLANRESFSAGMHPESAAFFQALDGTQLDYFASSLLFKRARDVAKMVPLLERLLESRFRHYFSQFAEDAVSTGAHKPLSDAMAFCDWLCRCDELGRLVREAARYERLRLGLGMKLEQLSSAPDRFRALPRRRPVLFLKRFEWGFPCLGDPEDPVPERTTWTLFAKVPGLNGIWYW